MALKGSKLPTGAIADCKRLKRGAEDKCLYILHRFSTFSFLVGMAIRFLFAARPWDWKKPRGNRAFLPTFGWGCNLRNFIKSRHRYARLKSEVERLGSRAFDAGYTFADLAVDYLEWVEGCYKKSRDALSVMQCSNVSLSRNITHEFPAGLPFGISAPQLTANRFSRR